MKHCIAILCLAFSLMTTFEFAVANSNAGAMMLLGEITRHKGKVVLVNFFATWCAPCREEIPGLVRLRQKYPVDKVVIIGISLDTDPAFVPPFVNMLGINYPVKMATEDVLRMFSIQSIPHNTVYDTAGHLVANQPGLIPEEVFSSVIDSLLEEKK